MWAFTAMGHSILKLPLLTIRFSAKMYKFMIRDYDDFGRTVKHPILDLPILDERNIEPA